MSGEDDEETLTEITESEAKEVLMTMIRDKPKNRTFQGAMKAKKNRDLARGFGAGRDGGLRPGTYKVSIEELKKRTKSVTNAPSSDTGAGNAPTKLAPRPMARQRTCTTSSVNDLMKRSSCTLILRPQLAHLLTNKVLQDNRPLRPTSYT